MLSRITNINRASIAAQLLIKNHKGFAHSHKAKQSSSNRIRGFLENEKTSVRELVDVYHHLANQTTQSSLFSLTEEKLLNLLTESFTDDEDDIVSKYVPEINLYDYSSLCNLFIEIASVGRRPTPLIKAASHCLAKLPLPEPKPRILTLISTLHALVKLNYPSRHLVSKIISDIKSMINLDEIDCPTQIGLLRSLGGLKWRHEALMKSFYDYVDANRYDMKKVTSNLIVTLLFVTANLNYKPPVDIKVFYDTHMVGQREDSIDRKSRKWLNYVWSLSILNVADESHFRSVLDDEFIEGIENPLGLQRFNHADVMKLLNLRAISKLEKRVSGINCKILDELVQQRIQRSTDLDKFGSKMKIALNSLVKSKNELRYDIQTPYGFVIDCEALLNKDMEFIPLDDKTTLEDELSLAETLNRKCDTNESRCAFIYVLFDEAIANHQDEPVGHKKIIDRILRNAGYRTVFLQECLLNRERSSSDLAIKIRETITTALKDNPI